MTGDEQIDSLSIEQSADGVAESKTATGVFCHLSYYGFVTVKSGDLSCGDSE